MYIFQEEIQTTNYYIDNLQEGFETIEVHFELALSTVEQKNALTIEAEITTITVLAKNQHTDKNEIFAFHPKRKNVKLPDNLPINDTMFFNKEYELYIDLEEEKVELKRL